MMKEGTALELICKNKCDVVVATTEIPYETLWEFKDHPGAVLELTPEDPVVQKAAYKEWLTIIAGNESMVIVRISSQFKEGYIDTKFKKIYFLDEAEDDIAAKGDIPFESIIQDLAFKVKSVWCENISDGETNDVAQDIKKSNIKTKYDYVYWTDLRNCNKGDKWSVEIPTEYAKNPGSAKELAEVTYVDTYGAVVKFTTENNYGGEYYSTVVNLCRYVYFNFS